jgi:hypothetical protein
MFETAQLIALNYLDCLTSSLTNGERCFEFLSYIG